MATAEDRAPRAYLKDPAKATERVLRLVDELTELLTFLAPEGGYVDGINWHVNDGMPNRIWASGSVRPTNQRMNFRPEHFNGWRLAPAMSCNLRELQGL